MSATLAHARPRRNPVPLVLTCALLAVGAVILAIFLGVVAIAPGEIVAVLTGKGSGEARSIILDIRLPRIVTGVLAGIHFAVAGL
ncbi:iron chelate uptake ABC transporter family permease subunit, partial [Acinetobacter baumannii]